MKKIFTYLLLSTLFFTSYAQNFPKGQIEIKDIKTNALYKDIKRANIYFAQRSSGKTEKAISFIDNSTLKYFPPIISQRGGSCAYASGIGYIYNYEYNLTNNLDSSLPENIYNYLQVYSFLNGGEDSGGHCQLGWKYAAENGLPSIKDGKTSTIYEWCTGYNAYYNGMDKNIVDYNYFESDQVGEIAKMKQYLIDHGNGSEHGGLIQFSAWADPLDPELYNGPQSSGYNAIMPYFGNDGMHSMTIYGFDDTVEYDYNGDGDIQDEEKGAFICVNTWGKSWGSSRGCTSNGRFYAPYYTFTTLKQSKKGVTRTKENLGGGTGNGGKYCLIVKTKKVERDLTLKIRLKHSSRNDIKLEIGVAATKGATAPEHTINKGLFMNFQGGDLPMQGKVGSTSYETLEFGVNISELTEFATGPDVTYFLKVIDKARDEEGSGEVLYCSVLDYRLNREDPIEFMAKMESSKLNNSSVCNAIIHTSMPELEEGQDFCINYDMDIYNYKMFLYFNSRNGIKAQIDLLDADKVVVKELVSKTLPTGVSSEKFDFNNLQAGTYGIRIIVGNKFIYKKLIIN